jgi:hypothetical protein
MPLSDHEQRILAQLEESLTKQDPRFVKNVRETTVYTHSGRRVRWGVAGFLAGLLVLLFCFSTSIVLGLLGVVMMFISAVVIERNARRLGRASWQDLTRSLHSDDDPQQGIDNRANAVRAWLQRLRHKSE